MMVHQLGGGCLVPHGGSGTLVTPFTDVLGGSAPVLVVAAVSIVGVIIITIVGIIIIVVVVEIIIIIIIIIVVEVIIIIIIFVVVVIVVRRGHLKCTAATKVKVFLSMVRSMCPIVVVFMFDVVVFVEVVVVNVIFIIVVDVIFIVVVVFSDFPLRAVTSDVVVVEVVGERSKRGSDGGGMGVDWNVWSVYWRSKAGIERKIGGNFGGGNDVRGSNITPPIVHPPLENTLCHKRLRKGATGRDNSVIITVRTITCFIIVIAITILNEALVVVRRLTSPVWIGFYQYDSVVLAYMLA